MEDTKNPKFSDFGQNRLFLISEPAGVKSKFFWPRGVRLGPDNHFKTSFVKFGRLSQKLEKWVATLVMIDIDFRI